MSLAIKMDSLVESERAAAEKQPEDCSVYLEGCETEGNRRFT
jgi:hypothetical protein